MKWRLIPFVLLAVLVIFFWRGLSLEPHTLPSVQLGKPLPAFQLSTVDDTRATFTPTVMHGQVALLNVWASWCDACTQEQGFLVQLAREGVPIYGLNYKDTREDATHWLAVMGNPYKMIGFDEDGRVAIDLGVYGAPETFLIDKKGVIRYRYAGVLNTQIWRKEFAPRIKKLEQIP